LRCYSLGEAANEYGNRALFAGTRLYFRSTMDRQGLGRIVQIPLWIVQEDRKDVVLGEDTGEYRFPMFNVERDLQAFGLGKNNLTLAFQWFFRVPREDGRYGHGAVGVSPLDGMVMESKRGGGGTFRALGNRFWRAVSPVR